VKRRILVTGSGGIGGVNFIRALREGEKLENDELFIVGTDFNSYHLQFPEVDIRYKTPRHNDPNFIKVLLDIVKKHKIEFLHPHPSVEARVVSHKVKIFQRRGVKTYIPPPKDIAPDKLTIHTILDKKGVTVPKTIHLEALEDIDRAFNELGSPLWIRAVTGAGGRLSLLVKTPKEARYWVLLNYLQGRAKIRDFIIQEYLPGRDIAFDSLWFKGKLITSYARQRLEYPFKHISLSGITGTPTVAKIINESKINRLGTNAVRALNEEPHGFYSVDIKEDNSGKPYVTEVDGKWHTTAPLWGYAFTKITSDNKYNLAYLYLKLGYGEEIKDYPPEYDLYPEGYYLVRQLDCGVLLVNEKGMKWRIL